MVVFDIDNTLFDSRSRTAEAANLYGNKHGITELATLEAEDAQLNGADTARAAGVTNAATIAAFQRFWAAFFFDGANFQYDEPLSSSIEWALAAKAAGAEIIYLTGREHRKESETRAQLEAAGLPDTDARSVISKPSSAKSTPDYKVKELEKLEQKAHIAWFLTESERDISAVQQSSLSVPCVVFEYPLGEAGNHSADPGTPRLPVDASPA